MEYILGIDIGTGSTKAVSVDLNYKSIGSSQQFYPTDSSEVGYSEQNPELIWEAFRQVIVEQISIQGSLPKAISLSSAMHSLIACDSGGVALLPMMTWADNRAAVIAEDLLASEEGKSLYLATGTPVHAMSPLCKIAWLRMNNAGIFSKTSKFLSIKEYIWYKLFNVFEADHSIGSTTGLMDLNKLCWNSPSLKFAGIEEHQLSQLVPTKTSRMYSRMQDYGLNDLPSGLIFIIGATDGCLANLGSGAIEPGVAALTIGTSGAIRVSAEKSNFNLTAMTFSYRMDEETFINGGPVNNGGIALKWHLKNILKRHDLTKIDYDQAFSAVAGIRPGAEGLIFLPYLQGERAPVWDARASACFIGLKLVHSDAHLIRAVVEGICFALEDVLLALENGGQEVKRIHVSGGFTASDVWLQILADITGKELVLVSAEDASAIGATLLAARALGLTTVYPSPDLKSSRRIYPDLQRYEQYCRFFGVYAQIYLALKNQMHQLLNLSMQSPTCS